MVVSHSVVQTKSMAKPFPLKWYETLCTMVSLEWFEANCSVNSQNVLTRYIGLKLV
jgi:hypothetical protein